MIIEEREGKRTGSQQGASIGGEVDKGSFLWSKMIEDEERCLKCGRQEGLQGVAVTIGRRTFHLFYLCAQCGNVGIEGLLQVIHFYQEKKPDAEGP